MLNDCEWIKCLQCYENKKIIFILNFKRFTSQQSKVHVWKLLVKPKHFIA